METVDLMMIAYLVGILTGGALTVVILLRFRHNSQTDARSAKWPETEMDWPNINSK